MVRNYTDVELLSYVKTLPSFVSIPDTTWILGVRSNADIPNSFDDKFYVFEGETFVMVLTGTTNPGETILKNHYKFNPIGAAVVKDNEWYYHLWHYGLHHGKVPALLQLGSKILIYRDGDKDNKSEQVGSVYSGYFGINFHPNNYDLNSKLTKTEINGWSAGCQVPNEITKYAELIKRFQVKKHPVTYCLIKEF